ncbi:MAG: coproporphyrinogen dehydrogenase HemZ [Lachnospiraceae bacterium]|nr:coproporphyrinogen dehydrogenase HemZ [Lachnospiraceae bacterium]
MDHNNFILEIMGLDFRQDVEPLIKEFFPSPGPGPKITIEAGEEEFTVMAELQGVEKVSERVVFTSANDSKIRHRDYRNQLLRALYRVLSKLTGQELPWGILTGVRPTKLLFERICRGEGKPLQFMEEKYYCSRPKAALAARIAAKEYQLLEAIDYKNGYSLYVGIPFCPSICNYCTFGSHPIGKFSDLVEPYIEALIREIKAVSDVSGKNTGPITEMVRNRKLETIYFGGGTPTSLEAEQLRRIIRCVKECFDLDHLSEFTVEAGRPDSITDEKLRMLKDEGVGRISINPQTFSDETLRIVGREHDSARIFEAFEMARKHGFDNINMDLIAGLTGETEEDFAHTLECVRKIDPECLTVHTLARKRAARITTQPELYEGYFSGGVQKMLQLADIYTKECGYEPYYMYRQKNMTDNLENVGYSKPGKECLYNILIMEEVQPILAVGAGASTKYVRDTQGRFGRIENCKSVREYVTRIDEMIDRKLSAYCT